MAEDASTGGAPVGGGALDAGGTFFMDHLIKADGSSKWQQNFAAADCHCGQSLIVWAFNEGRGAARESDRYLMSYTNLP